MVNQIGSCVALMLMLSAPVAAKTITAADSVNADSQISITLGGIDNPRDFVTIVSADSKEGRYGDYQYTTDAQLTLFAPYDAGNYEIRWLSADSPFPTLASRPLQVKATTAELEAPARAAIASTIEIGWKGPNNPKDFITLVKAGAANGEFGEYAYTAQGARLNLKVPGAPGDYELRYLTGRGYRTLASHLIRIDDTQATISLPSSVTAGQQIAVNWQGPANRRDFLTIVKAEEAEGSFGDYRYVEDGSPLMLRAPDQPGQYEVRYMLADASRTLARAPVTVIAATASIQGPPQVVAGSQFKVSWTGPDGDGDYLAMTLPEKTASLLSFSYTRRGTELSLLAPKQPGRYQLHYLTGQSQHSLAMQPIEVIAASSPGFVQIQPLSPAQNYAAIALVVDASGSMLQRLDGKRRIDIAKATLSQLVDTLPTNSRLALRVFGHLRPDSCDAELLQPPAPLQTNTLKAMINRLEPQNLARTPIAASLQQLRQDLNGEQGKLLAILVTDGEETCQGDPMAAITQLRQSGLDLRVNIVGFAIDEQGLKQQFSQWADAAGGAYFDAADAKGLATALHQSMSQPYTILDAQGLMVHAGAAGDPPVALAPGRYQLRSGNHQQSLSIVSGETHTITLQ